MYKVQLRNFEVRPHHLPLLPLSVGEELAVERSVTKPNYEYIVYWWINEVNVQHRTVAWSSERSVSFRSGMFSETSQTYLWDRLYVRDGLCSRSWK